MKLLLLIATSVFSFIPPIPTILEEMFAGRERFSALTISYRLQEDGSEVEFEEQFVRREDKLWVSQFRFAGKTVVALRNRDGYRFAQEKISSRSAVVPIYLLGSAEELLQALLAERFMRRDQLVQFRAPYDPQGDPRTWPVRENFVLHPDISFQRSGSGVAAVVKGVAQEGERELHFDPKRRGLMKVVWRGPKTVSWSFESFEEKAGLYPSSLSFSDGQQIVHGRIIQVRPLKTREVSAFKGMAPSGEIPSSLRDLLTNLLAYR